MLIAVVAGALLGITLGTVGGGGAVLAVPVLVYLLDQPVHDATTASLVIVLGAAAVAAVGHARRGSVCWRVAAAFTAAAIPGGLIGTVANRAIGSGVLLGGFAVLLVAVAMLTWRGAAGVGSSAADACPPVAVRAVVLAGLGVGLLTGLFGVGGGFVIVPALALLLHVPFRKAIGTSLVIVTAVSAIGLGEHVAAGANLDWAVVAPFALAAMITASFGPRLAARLRRRTLARAFALLLAAVAVYLVISIVALGGPPHG